MLLNRPAALVGAHPVKVALPIEFPAKTFDYFLFLQLNEGFQSKLHSLSFGSSSTGFDCIRDELFVDVDADFHGSTCDVHKVEQIMHTTQKTAVRWRRLTCGAFIPGAIFFLVSR